MKVLYAAYRNEPLDPNDASGADYQFHRALLEQGLNVNIAGPFPHPAIAIERVLKRLYRRYSKNRYIKYDLTTTLRAAREVNTLIQTQQPDVLFSLYPPALAFSKSHIPCVLRTDTTFIGMHREGAEFLRHGELALNYMVWLERRAFQKCAMIITHSAWSKQVLEDEYAVPSERIAVFANPAALPPWVVPPTLNLDTKILKFPVRLLLVGRDYRRKGIDIAITIVRQLNEMNIPAELTICGIERPNGVDNDSRVRYGGYFDKTRPEELQEYVRLYENAHLLLHPTRFDASPIVASEAAAFGTPTITNNVGGLATSVRDGESGVVLPPQSAPELYARTIVDLVENPARYYELCQHTRQRYERELNWDVAGKQVAAILRDVVDQRDQPRTIEF